jgi:hypothetical protein
MAEPPVDIQEVVQEEAVATEEAVEEPPASKAKRPPRAPRAPKVTRITRAPKVQPVEQQVPVIDTNFWTSMIQTRRQMERAETATRYANLVKL